MSNADGKCDCAAFGPDECVCGAWDDVQRTTNAIRRAVDAACTCGGGEHGNCCPACHVWHVLYPANAHALPEPLGVGRSGLLATLMEVNDDLSMVQEEFPASDWAFLWNVPRSKTQRND